MEKITLKFYTIYKCGYYKPKDTKNYLTDISDLLDNIKDWIDSKTLEETLTTNKLSAKSEKLPVYCLNVTKSSVKNTYLITTWNKVETTDGNISSIKIDEPIKTASKNVSTTKLPKNSIPGYATYFYVIPEDNILATIRFNHISNGHIGLNSYIKGFLTFYSKYTQFIENEEDKSKIEILGYGTSKKDYDDNLHPYFKSSLKRTKTNTDKILSSVNSISKMIRKTTISTAILSEKNLYDNLMEFLGTKSNNDNEEFQLKYEMKVKPTKDNVTEIIKSWNKKDSWDDIGFQIKGEDNPIWLSADIPTKELELKINRTNDEFVDFDDLIKKLDNNLDSLKKSYK